MDPSERPSAGKDVRPAVTLVDKDGNELSLAGTNVPAHYFLPASAMVNLEDGVKVEVGDVIARIPQEGSKTRDITGGLPRVAELFEARRPKDFAVISEGEGRVEFGNDYKAKRRIRVVPTNGDLDAVEYLLPKGRPLAVNEGDVVRKGDLLLDGSPVPHDILSIAQSSQASPYHHSQCSGQTHLQSQISSYMSLSQRHQTLQPYK